MPIQEPTWKYRCSICDELVDPNEVREHTELEKAKPSWPGMMRWTREDD